ncbi:hypothetical protein [Paraburkholderia sp. BCC1884]|uniref:hypothetical protein n=1 Tax=Paraburkholderia sp. BCC1884 TaxID=2562668 RepID=UPI001181D75D|nr:hypothetical protein [Paraburkholderia sp. BCC1884]
MFLSLAINAKLLFEETWQASSVAAPHRLASNALFSFETPTTTYQISDSESCSVVILIKHLGAHTSGTSANNAFHLSIRFRLVNWQRNGFLYAELAINA